MPTIPKLSLIYSRCAHYRDNKPAEFPVTWQEFADELARMAQVTRSATDAMKSASPTISPSVYDGALRRKENVLGWGGWLATDHDNNTLSIDDAVDLLVDGYDSPFVLYTTTSSSLRAPRFRIIVPLDRDVERAECTRVWWALGQRMGNTHDESCKDLSRIYSAPANWIASDEQPEPCTLFHARLEGTPFSVDDLLREAEGAQILIEPDFTPTSVLPAGPAWNDAPRELVTPDMRSWFGSVKKRTYHRVVWQLMCKVAARARFLGVPLTADELVGIVRAEAQSAPPARWVGIRSEAENVLGWAIVTLQPCDPVARRLELEAAMAARWPRRAA